MQVLLDVKTLGAQLCFSDPRFVSHAFNFIAADAAKISLPSLNSSV